MLYEYWSTLKYQLCNMVGGLDNKDHERIMERRPPNTWGSYGLHEVMEPSPEHFGKFGHLEWSTLFIVELAIQSGFKSHATQNISVICRFFEDRLSQKIPNPSWSHPFVLPSWYSPTAICMEWSALWITYMLMDIGRLSFDYHVPCHCPCKLDTKTIQRWELGSGVR